MEGERELKKKRGVNKNRKLICPGTCLVPVWLCVCVCLCVGSGPRVLAAAQSPARNASSYRDMMAAAQRGCFFPLHKVEPKSFRKTEEKKEREEKIEESLVQFRCNILGSV